MARENIERQNKLQPTRMETAIKSLNDLGIKLEYQDETVIWFHWMGHRVTYWPYSGWSSGQSIKDGRGLSRLLKQLKAK